MKYYEELVDLQCFSRADVVTLTGNEHTADSLIIEYKRKGYIQSVRRNSYVTISMETKMPVANRYRIATNIMSGSYISHHSAFEYYGCANQVFHEVYVSGINKFAPFEYDDVFYRYIAPRIDVGIDGKADGIRVTDIERTLLDSINDFEKIGGLEELLRCIEMILYLDEAKLIAYLDQYDKHFLYQKAGYILEHMKKPLRLSEKFFKHCEVNQAKSVRYLYHGIEHEPNMFQNKWNLIVPKDLMKLLSDGGTELAEF